jgi:hypothetical protein
MRIHSIIATLGLLIATTVVESAASNKGMCDDPPCTKRQIQAYERAVSKHMLRTQQARFEALARGEKGRVSRYDRQFKQTQQRWMGAKRALETAGN